MQLCPNRFRRTTVALVTAATLGGGLIAAATASAAPPAPPSPPSGPRVTAAPNDPGVSNPSDQQLNGASARKAALDQQVGLLGGQIAAAQARLDQLQRNAELAEQKVAYAVTEYRQAIAAAQRAQADSAAAGKRVDDAQVRFARYMQAVYMDGRPEGLAGNLLSARDPSAMLDQASYQQYESAHNAGVIGQMKTLSVAKSNAHARAARAQQVAQRKKREAEDAQRAASEAVRTQQEQEAGLEATMNSKQDQLTAAKAQVVQLYNNRATYTEYVRQRAAFNAYVAYRSQYKRYQGELQAYKERIAAERARQAAAAKAAAKHHKKRGGGGGGGGSYDPDPPAYNPPAPSGGSWSQAKGNAAVKRAKAYLGTMYAWAGGTANGPTYGVCAGDGAYNDCYIKGFDCSGLVMYAWHKNWDHYADTQYSQAGSYHPSISRLKPGDLMFFGYHGGGGDLHHVAMYVGHQKMIEAPQSGDVIQISSIFKYSDYYGATRPLT